MGKSFSMLFDRPSFKYVRASACLVSVLIATTASGQDSIFSITRATSNYSSQLAVFDVRPATAPLHGIRNEIESAFRVNFDGLLVKNYMMPNPLPEQAPRMRFERVDDLEVPDCRTASTQITARDSSFSKYGEGTVIQACVFPYSHGFRVNVYATHIVQNGGANSILSGGGLGRVITKAMGLGDTSRFIYTTIDDIESRLSRISEKTSLVELHPPRENKPTVPDPANTSATSTPVSVAGSRPMVVPEHQPPRPGLEPINVPPRTQVPPFALSPENSNKLAERFAEVRALQDQVLGKVGQSGVSAPSIEVQARKELSAMGLTYHSTDDFVAAVRRNDIIAVRLFLQGKGVSLTTADKFGMTPLRAATTDEMKNVLSAN